MDAKFKRAVSAAQSEVNRCWGVEEFHGWLKVTVKDRIDSFNFDAFHKELSSLVQETQRPLALEVSQVRFLSLKAIQFLADLATLILKDGARAALVAPSEKLKRQIDIYADLELWEIYRNLGDLAANRPDSPGYSDRSEGPGPSL